MKVKMQQLKEKFNKTKNKDLRRCLHQIQAEIREKLKNSHNLHALHRQQHKKKNFHLVQKELQI